MEMGFGSFLKGVCLALMAATLAAGPGHTADFPAWSRSADFRLNTTASGAGIAGDVADFPVLIRLDSSNFPFSEAKADGSDIRFAGPGGEELALEIERWDAAVKRAEIWVKVGLIKGGTDTGFVRMYWGNPLAAPVSDGKAVFGALGFAGVWHLQGDVVADAAGASANGDGTRTAKAAALIAGGRAWTANNQGIIIPGGSALAAGAAITASAWIYADSWSGGNRRILQKGPSENQYALVEEGDSLAWILGGPTGGSTVRVPLPPAGAWHLIAATYDGSASKVFVDGALVKSLAATGPVRDSGDDLCIGCRTGPGKPHNSFDGRMDEVALARVARSSDWIKLAFANQRALQVLVVHPTLVQCQARFSAPGDTTVQEGQPFALSGTAECASGYAWSAVEGPASRILDPEAQVLQTSAPRIPRDTLVVYRFTARFGETYRSGDVRVRVKETIPDPVFNLPAVAAWNGRDPLVIAPAIGNLASVKASRDSVIRFAWTLAGLEADTAWQAGKILLKQAMSSGKLELGLCLDNGGAAYCRTMTIPVELAVAIRRGESGPGPRIQGIPRAWWRDVAGRRRPMNPSLSKNGWKRNPIGI